MAPLARLALPLALLSLFVLPGLLAPGPPRCQPIPPIPVDAPGGCAADADCVSGSPCRVGTCDPVTHACVFADAPNGTPCSDANPCTCFDVCHRGVCEGRTCDCDDGNPCTADYSDADGVCWHTPLTGSCDDYDACTTGDTCQEGRCVGGPPANCDDGDPCTVDRCEPTGPLWDPCRHRLTENCAGRHDERCHDMLDNDEDGLVDMDDPDCATVPCGPEPEECAAARCAGRGGRG